jgi:outer membrane biosynthesis protein TonB
MIRIANPAGGWPPPYKVVILLDGPRAVKLRFSAGDEHPCSRYERKAMRETAEHDGKSRRREPLGLPLIGSAVLHVSVLLLLLFGLPGPAPGDRVIPIDIVFLGEETTSPAAEIAAPLPQKSATEATEAPPEQAVPAEETPPPPAAARKAPAKSAPDMAAVAKPEAKPEAPRPVKAEEPDRQPAAKLKRQPLPADDLSARLERLARLRQLAPPLTPSPRRQYGSGASDQTAAASEGAPAEDARYGVKDFIRAQVERRWNPDRDALKGRDWVVAIHVLLRPDGSVERAEIVEDRRRPADSTYDDFARSARNAVLLSSPLTVPPGEYEIAKDIVLDFHSRQALQ